ncbi:MAG: 50S ribosomal protein L24e [archaeon]
MAECSFCGEKLKPGTGFLFVKKDGTPFFFCSRKCERNMLFLKRKPIATKWTEAFRQAKQAGKAGAANVKVEAVAEEKKEAPAKAKKKRARRKKKR